jgi:DNA-binding HxlR family transcriptional regulator
MGTIVGMTRRSYGQFCGLAHALDVVGERWTLLIVRELCSGPKRYGELAESLAGIGTSLLASRMRQLEGDNVIRRRLDLDQPGSAVVYELAPAGRELAEAMIPLAMWGARHQMTHADADSEAFRAEWLLSFLAVDVREDVPDDMSALYEFHIDDSVACLRVRDGRVSVSPGPSSGPIDVTVRATATAVAGLLGQKIQLADALADGQIEVTGDPDAVAVLIRVIEKRLPVA